MENIRVKKDDLLARLIANRDNHQSIYAEASAGYRAQVIEGLKAALASAESGGKIIQSLDLTVPVDRTTEYDTIIDMVECNIGDEIELDQRDFRRYMRDEFEWQVHFLASNAGYSATARGLVQ